MPQEKKSPPPSVLLDAGLAKALANRWRNRILIELHLRPMSPKQFAEEFDAPGLSTTSRYFRELKDWGYLEIAEERRGGKRRGAVEKIYRAIQRVYFDTPTWERLPRFLRDECSGVVLEGLVRRITQAVTKGTFDAEKDRHLSWKSFPLDRQAWAELVAHLDELMDWIGELEVESAGHVAETGEQPIPVTVALLAFRSPPSPNEAVKRSRGKKRTARSEPLPFLMSPEMAKALANSWRNRILIELHLRPMSPSRFFDEFGGPELTAIARYFRQLKKWGFLEIVDKRRGGKRRGAVEKIYRATRRVHFDTETWGSLPRELRDECSGAVLEGLILRINQAVEAETFDAETDRHLSWKALWLSRKAWTEYVTRLDEVLDWISELENESAKRLAERNEEAIPTTAALMAFRAPEPNN